MKSWKTTVAGIIVAGVAFSTYMGWITPEQGTAILGAATAVGLVAAKDSNVTGGTK
jgi:hypothetical protein